MQLIKVGPEFDAIGATTRRCERVSNIATAKSFGVKDPEKIIDVYVVDRQEVAGALEGDRP